MSELHILLVQYDDDTRTWFRYTQLAFARQAFDRMTKNGAIGEKRIRNLEMVSTITNRGENHEPA